MNMEVVKEIGNLLAGTSGEIHVTMVNHEFTIQKLGNDDALYVMVNFIIGIVAKEMGMTFREYVEMLEDLCNGAQDS